VTGWILAALLAVAAVLFVVYLSMTAGRLDHLHRRIDASRATLDAQLLRRSAVCTELAASGLLDPAASLVLSSAAHEASQADLSDPDRMRAESDVTAALLAALEPDDVSELAEHPIGADLLDEVDAACRRVQLSRRFHNDGVRACRQLRRQRIVRLFRLAGHTPWPHPWEMDDTPPPQLGVA
jgi:hypothetical protein